MHIAGDRAQLQNTSLDPSGFNYRILQRSRCCALTFVINLTNRMSKHVIVVGLHIDAAVLHFRLINAIKIFKQTAHSSNSDFSFAADTVSTDVIVGGTGIVTAVTHFAVITGNHIFLGSNNRHIVGLGNNTARPHTVFGGGQPLLRPNPCSGNRIFSGSQFIHGGNKSSVERY